MCGEKRASKLRTNKAQIILLFTVTQTVVFLCPFKAKLEPSHAGNPVLSANSVINDKCQIFSPGNKYKKANGSEGDVNQAPSV